MATVFEPIRPVPPMTTIFMVRPPCRWLESPKWVRMQVRTTHGHHAEMTQLVWSVHDINRGDLALGRADVENELSHPFWRQ
jgi:hypothetical protein